jgi:parallel beta-helix repeat protein
MGPNNNVVEGNSIGIDITGTRMPNAKGGIDISAGNTGITTNTIAFNGGPAITVFGTAVGLLIDGNSIYSNDAQGVLVTGRGLLSITNNLLSANGAQGILLEAGDGDLIQSNSVSGNSLDGILVDADVTSLVVGGADSSYGNTISQNGQAGVHFLSGDHNTVSFNTISQNPAGGIVVEGGDQYPTTSIDENVLDSLVVDAGSVDVSGPSPVDTFLFSGGTLGGGAVLTVNSYLHWTAGMMTGGGRTDLASAATGLIDNPAALELQRLFNNWGTISWTGSGAISIDAAAIFTNEDGASLTASGTGAPASEDGSGTFDNIGSYIETGLAALPDPAGSLLFVNTGTMDVDPSAVFAMAGTYTQPLGTTSIAGSGSCNVQGPVHEDGGTVSLGDTSAGGTLSASAGTQVAGGALLYGYGAINGDLTNSGGFEVGLHGVSAATLTLTGKYTQNAGTGTIDTGDTLSVTDLVTENGGTFTLNSSNLDAPAGTFIDGGVFSGGGNVYGDVTNASEVDERNTLLSITGDFTETAGTTFIAGNGLTVSGAVTVQGGTFTVAGAVVQAGDGMQIESGGTLYGNGQITVIGGLTNAGLINLAGGSGPGAIPGAIYVNGDYTQTSAGVLDVHLYSNSTYDALIVSGLATLGGTLNVTAMYGYRPGPGAIFSVVRYGSRSGTFATISLPGVAFGHWETRYDDPNYPNQLTLWVVY